MNYNEAMEYIHSTHRFGSRPGLEAIRSLLELMGNPHDKLKFVHVGGTNGKGSTVAFISSILIEAGYRVGVYTSPSIQRFSERIKVNNAEIGTEAISTITDCIKDKAEIMLSDGKAHPTEFEIVTALAFQYFFDMKCDVVVLEVGLGGRFDATNIINSSLASVITTINYDHMDKLGDTLEKIAFEKAGIIKPDGEVVLYPQPESVRQVFSDICAQRHANLNDVEFSDLKLLEYSLDGQVFDFEGYKKVRISLLGEHQIRNAALALKTIEVLIKKGYYVNEGHIYKGLLNTKWPGRLEVLKKKPVILIDGAHNPEGALVLLNALSKYFPDKKVTFIMGVMGDKDYTGIIQTVMPVAKRFVTVTPDVVKRALPGEQLAEVIRNYCDDVKPAVSIYAALKECLEHEDDEGVICAFGSLYYIGEIRKIMGLN